MSHSNNAYGVENLNNSMIKYRNFEGRGTSMNNKGNRNFCLLLSDEMADYLEGEGFYVKTYVRSNGDTERLLKVNVKFESQYPPDIEVFTKNGSQMYGAAEAAVLDDANIVKGEVWFNGYTGPKSDHKTAWLDELIVAIQDNDRRKKYMSLFEQDELPNEQMPWD